MSRSFFPTRLAAGLLSAGVMGVTAWAVAQQETEPHPKPLAETFESLSEASAITPPASDAPADLGAGGATIFFQQANGPLALTVAADEFVVAVDAAQQAADGGRRPRFLPALSTPAELGEEIADLEARLERRGLYVVRGDIAAVRGRPGVRYALPVLYEANGDVPFYQTDRIVAAFRPEVTADQVRALADQLGLEAEPRARGGNRWMLTVAQPVGVEVLELANQVHARADLVEYAHPDFLTPLVAYAPPTIQDPLYLTHQWHMDGDVAKGAAAGSDINAEAAWDSDYGAFAQGNPLIRVAIQDECVEKLHPDLFPNWHAGIDYDEVPPDDDPSPDAGQRHGTACAGVAVAKGNTIGVRGACPDCGLMGVKFFGGTVADIADSYYWCIDPDDNGDHSDGAAVLSNSWGFASGTFLPSDVATAINIAATTGRNGKGVLVCFAAANSDHTVNGISALAQLESVTTIGGTNSNAEHTEFSDVGPEVALSAPTNDRGDDGVRFPWIDITTVDNTGSSGYNGLPDLDYTNAFGGTSSATPLAAGVLGLILSQDAANMTAAQALAIAQHTSVRLDEPYGRHDPITGHSHRFGYGRVDAAAAMAAVHAGIRWPHRIKQMSAFSAGPAGVSLNWDTPAVDYAGSVLVRSDVPFGWTPTDGVSYTVGQVVAPGVEVVYTGAAGVFADSAATDGAAFYGVFARSAANYYSFGAKAHVFIDAITLFSDNSEGPDPGWTHGGAGDEWARGTPTSANGSFGQVVVGSGPLLGLNGQRAIAGNTCWGTDLASTYNAFADAWLQTPLINLTGVSAPVFLEYYDWCMLETFYDQARLEVVDQNDQLIGLLDGDTGGDYDWTRRVVDLTPFAGQPIKVRFRLTTDGTIQRDGWFIDDVRVVLAANIPLPPVADSLYKETPANMAVAVQFQSRDPNPGQQLQHVILTLPADGTLTDPQPGGGVIASTPYTLLNNGTIAVYTPDPGFEGPDGFTYRATDGGLNSNDAQVDLVVGTAVPKYTFNLNTNPGWLRDGLWQFGLPLGQGGDPSSAFTGLNVYGYNLNGAYENNLAPQYLTTLPMNCEDLSRVTLRFARWLCVESATWDSAGVEISIDGQNWNTVFNNATANLAETAWSVHEYNVGPIADGQPFVQFRWRMGPTDSADVFCGWNLDDIQVMGIGAASVNQPPLALGLEKSTARNDSVLIELSGLDSDADDLSFTIEALPADGSLSDPNGAPIAAAPHTLPGGRSTLRYTPDAEYTGFDEFAYSVDDGAASSNQALVRIDVLNVAAFPFSDGFESGGPLATWWRRSSTATGRVQVSAAEGPQGAFHVLIDSSREGEYARNQLDLIADLEGASFVRLSFDWKEFGEESHPLPATWTGAVDGDGAAFSADGVTWHRLLNFTGPQTAYTNVLIDLDAAVAAAGVTYTNAFRIRFQQYDNFPVPSDGIALDNVQLIQGTTDPVIATFSLPNGLLNAPYGPIELQTLGGDAPLDWSVLDVYGEEDLNANLMPAGGVGQGWIGGNVTFNYTLPFSFPFYGQNHTSAIIGSDGFINFAPVVGSTFSNSELLLAANRRIAVLWDNLRTDGPGNDIFVDESVAGQVTIRWQAITHTGSFPCSFAATLFDDGRIQLHYGAGNTNLTPTIGVSAGDNVQYTLAAYDGDASLTGVDSIEFDQSRLPPGMSLSVDGELSGTPTQAGRFKPILRIEDQSARTHTRMLPIVIVPELFGDYDVDGDVDQADFESFTSCMGQNPAGGDCLEAFDDNLDGLIDVSDFARFQREFTGP